MTSEPGGATQTIVETIATNERVELEMLREFYRSWVGLHKIPRDKLHRRKQEAQAQLLVNNAHTLQRFYEATNAAEAPEKPALRLVESNG